MKPRLLFRDRDFDWRWALDCAVEREAVRSGRRFTRSKNFDPHAGLPWNADALTADLALDTLFAAMAGEDDCIFAVAQKAILTGTTGDLGTIRYRQDVLRDCLAHPTVIRELYDVAVTAAADRKGDYLGVLGRYPDWVLRNGLETMAGFLQFLKSLRRIADSHADKFTAEGWIAFWTMVKRDLPDDYLGVVEDHLKELRLRNGVLVSATLGRANKGSDYLFHRAPCRPWAWWHRLTALFESRPPVYSFTLHPRDEAGAQALNALRNRGISLAAAALGRSADHVRDFFRLLRTELAFYVGCLNLHARLADKREPTCMPVPTPTRELRLSFRGLYDAALALTLESRAVGNDTNTDMKDLVVITGPNGGGKSTFLRGLGLAQLMMQSGMFVAAQSFSAGVCAGLFTHFKREEDVGMESGKFDEELGRMSAILDHVEPHSIVLFNESFSSTNEREGSEIARQIVSALREAKVKVFYVTHMYELAHRLHSERIGGALFLRAQRGADGARTFKLAEGEPLATSFGEDVYNKIFSESEMEAIHAGI